MRRSLIMLMPLLCGLGLAGCARKEAPVEPVRAVRTMVIASQNAGGTLEYAGEVRARSPRRGLK
jgi:multidrug efflux system membrane fusion protein